jgi:hypothetical protein
MSINTALRCVSSGPLTLPRIQGRIWLVEKPATAGGFRAWRLRRCLGNGDVMGDRNAVTCGGRRRSSFPWGRRPSSSKPVGPVPKSTNYYFGPYLSPVYSLNYSVILHIPGAGRLPGGGPSCPSGRFRFPDCSGWRAIITWALTINRFGTIRTRAPWANHVRFISVPDESGLPKTVLSRFNERVVNEYYDRLRRSIMKIVVS